MIGCFFYGRYGDSTKTTEFTTTTASLTTQRDEDILLCPNVPRRFLYTEAVNRFSSYDTTLKRIQAVFDGDGEGGEPHLVVYFAGGEGDRVRNDLDGKKWPRFFSWDDDEDFIDSIDSVDSENLSNDDNDENKGGMVSAVSEQPLEIPDFFHPILPPRTPSKSKSKSKSSPAKKSIKDAASNSVLTVLTVVSFKTVSPVPPPPPRDSTTSPGPYSKVCVICQERLTTDPESHGKSNVPPPTMTTLCGHTFHLSCFRHTEAKTLGGVGASCPICRYSLTCEDDDDGPSEFSINGSSETYKSCSTCGRRPEYSLGGHVVAICLICGDVGCKDACGKAHFHSTSHTYAKELGGTADDESDDRIWDYAGGGYVNRLIDGVVEGNESVTSTHKIVEVATPFNESMERARCVR